MTAKGKINASKVQAGDRILVKWVYDARGHQSVTLSGTKTGQGVETARVTGKMYARPPGGFRAQRVYTIHTTAGPIVGCQPIQTMWLAPEDPAGVKRAHVEALAENETRTRLDTAVAQAFEAEAPIDLETPAPAVDPDDLDRQELAAFDREQQMAGRTLRPEPNYREPVAVRFINERWADSGRAATIQAHPLVAVPPRPAQSPVERLKRPGVDTGTDRRLEAVSVDAGVVHAPIPLLTPPVSICLQAVRDAVFAERWEDTTCPTCTTVADLAEGLPDLAMEIYADRLLGKALALLDSMPVSS